LSFEDLTANISQQDMINPFETPDQVSTDAQRAFITTTNMINSATQAPSPHLFMGGSPSDYWVYIGEAGTWCTEHIESGRVIQSVKPDGGESMLQVGNFGLGLLNLGVGIFNAYQLHKVHEDLSEQRQLIQTGFTSVHSVLDAQHRTLELLVSNQHTLNHRMDILRQEMYAGFQQVVEEVRDVEARKFRQDFETRTFKLFRAYKRFGEMLPDAQEADVVIDRAEELEAWIRTHLKQIRDGWSERLPLLVALTFSIRAKADAFESKGGRYSDFAAAELKALSEQLLSEVYNFCYGRSLYALGVQMPEILYQYVLLNRSLRKGLELKGQDAPKVIFSAEDVTWTDGLDELRAIFEPVDEDQPSQKLKPSTLITLNTLPDYEWYVRFKGEERSTFKVHSVQSLSLREILRDMGHPNPEEVVIKMDDRQILMNFALPEAWNRFAKHLQTEFSWENPLLLLSI